MVRIKSAITDFATSRYRLVTILMVLFTVGLGAFIPLIKVDTDPENMLSETEAVRIFHNETKDKFNLNDIVVVGIVNDKDANGVFNPSSLSRIYELTEFAKTLRWPDKDDPEKLIGVVEVDLMAPSTVDDITQAGLGQISLDWLMQSAPKTQAEAAEVRKKAMANPLFVGSLVSEDEQAVCLYLPLTSKDLSYRVYKELREKISGFEGDEKYYITGLPVAEDTFGVEMFVQMAVSAPLAMVVIFLLMLVFFRKLVLIISPMIIALVSVISTMGLLIGFGFPVHIMSSMIPIFLMPIAVVDSIHILSEFFDLYTKDKGRKETILEVMGHLFTPMLYTSLTSAAGFASLALTPIPPVQVFGIFVAVGIMIAWIFTVTFVPAYVMLMSEKSLENFGRKAVHEEKQSWLTKILRRAGLFTYAKAKPILAGLAIIIVAAVYGITRININDNPVKWFSKSHPIRQADRVLNSHFGGTYMAYLVIEPQESSGDNITEYIHQVRSELLDMAVELEPKFPNALEVVDKMDGQLRAEDVRFETRAKFIEKMTGIADKNLAKAEDKELDLWYEISTFCELQAEKLKVFKQPEVLEYISGLQGYLQSTGLVGKSTSVADIVKKVHQELTDGRKENYKIPDSQKVIGECLFQFQGGHKPWYLWHFVSYDYMHTNIWLQLTSGDNRDMQKVVRQVDKFFAENKTPVPLGYNWAGLTYINVEWQEKMVWGMLQSFLGSFIIVFIMMAILFRSALWGIVCMVPLSLTILVIYGIIGILGKDYDMPVAVLSALTLGMAVDFAIHFLERARESYKKFGSWKESASVMFGGPARAISRNVLVIAIGFLPLLAAPLVPYKTVGIFLCAIMALSGLVTLLVLAALLRLFERRLFAPEAEPVSPACNCGLCLIISAVAVVLIALNLHQYWHLGFGKLALFSIIIVPLMALVCGIMSRRKACKITGKKESEV